MLNIDLINLFISKKRFNAYKNLDEYSQNLIFSKNSYIPLSVLEIALRNSLDRYLSKNISDNWYENDFLTQDSKKKVQQAKDLLFRRGETQIKDKIIAELSFGFWVNLFKKPYEKNMRINDLKAIFPNLPSKNKQNINRQIIFNKLNHIRIFRNRIFHHEKVLNRDGFNDIFLEIEEMLSYFSNDLVEFNQSLQKS